MRGLVTRSTCVLTRYARWHVVGRVKSGRHGHIPANVEARCRGGIDVARAFLDHLTANDRDLDDCPQAFLDAWTTTTDRGRRLGFIRWLKRGGYLPLTRLPEPAPRQDPDHEVDPDDQIALARHLLHEPDSASIEDRAAACLILLHAQPVAKIASLTTNDIEIRDGDTHLALGTEPLLLIPPLDALITALPVAKPFGTASTLADSRWLFTGKDAGTHLHPASLMRRMNQLGITARTSKNTALLHLAATTPTAVFVSLVGVSIGTATRWAGLAGASWNTYAAGPGYQSDPPVLRMTQDVQNMAVWTLHEKASDSPRLIGEGVHDVGAHLPRQRIDRIHIVDLDRHIRHHRRRFIA